MTIERIEQIRDALIVRDDDDLVPELIELRELAHVFHDGVYQQKIRDAIGWAEIYVDPERRAIWDSEVESGREAVMRFLFNDLDDASRRAREVL